MAELTIEQRRAIALAAARLRLQDQEASADPIQEGGRGALPFLNRGIATVLGAPVDLANFALSATGLPTSERPFGGSESIQAGMRRVSPTMAPAPGQEAETLAEYVGRGVGETAGFLIPGMGLASRAARSINPVTAGVGRALTAAPVSGAGIDLAAGAGAGAGRFYGEELTPDDPNMGGVLGELAGGLSVGGTMAALGAVPRLIPVVENFPISGAVIGTARQIAGAFAPGTDAGSRVRATGRLQSLVADPREAARLAESQSIGNLTPAQRTGDDQLIELERAVAEANPVIARQLAERAQASQATIEEELRGMGGAPTAARSFLEGVRDRAEGEAERRVSALDTGIRPAEQSRVVREAFDSAYADARRQENALWSAIPDDVQLPVAPLRLAWQRMVAETPTTQRQDLPNYARRFLDTNSKARLPDNVNPRELQGLRSSLLDIERQATAADQRNRARLAGQLADSVLETMNPPDVDDAFGLAQNLMQFQRQFGGAEQARAASDALRGLGSRQDYGEAYNAARAFSRDLNQTFRQGEISMLTRTGRDGAGRVAPELTLETTLGRGGERGSLAARELTAALGPRADTARPAIQDYLRGQVFNQFVTPDGQIREAALSRWMRQNAGLLDQYPEVRSQLSDTMRAQAEMRRLGGGSPLPRRQETAVARYLGGDFGNEISRVFSAQNPAKMVNQLRRQVARDPSGQALAGLKGSFSDYLITAARQNTPDGAVLSGSSISGVLADPRQRAALERVYSPSEMQRLRQIARELTNLEKARRGKSLSRVMDDTPNRVMEIIARIIGARVGAAGGGAGLGGGLQGAAIVSGAAKNFLGRLTNDRAAQLLSQAVTDQQLFGALMMPGRSLAAQPNVAKRFDAWLAGPGLRAFEEDEEEE